MAKKKTDAPMAADPVERLMSLFPGNQRASGRFDPAKSRNWTEDAPLRREDWIRHLKGEEGCGSIPIQDDDTCMWAGIDMDNHGQDEDLPINEIETLSRERGLPLVMCRTKSGGIHAYVFMNKATPAGKLQVVLTKWAAFLGYPKAEIFPKQARLVAMGGKPRPTGNYMNMPYMGGLKTNRYAVHEGKKLSLDEFLTLAEKQRVSEAGLRTQELIGHEEAPPCMQAMLTNGVAQGQRNEALYNITVYFKKLDPQGYEKLVADANVTAFSKPLGRAEMLRTMGSAARPECGYRCNEEPLKTLCDRPTCLKRKYGITPSDADRLATHEALPEFTGLIKYMSDPVRWDIMLDNIWLSNITTESLLDWKEMRRMIAERLTRIVPMIKSTEWDRILAPLMKNARMVEAPDDASMAGVVRDRLREFASKTDLTARGDSTEDKKALLRGLPVVQRHDGERVVMFRGQDFINYLKRTKSEELKGINLWFAVKEVGVQHMKTRAGTSNINVWYLPVKEVQEADPPKPEYRTDL